jgi:spermidine/putrescine transport system ATP-binding protein
MPLLSIAGITKRFGSQEALKAVSLDIAEGEFVALLGPSGCGKTTLLRCIAGFLAPDEGSIAIGGEDVTRLPPYRRPLNTVFQNYALFPHMNVRENVAYGPRRHGASRAEAAARAAEALSLVGLDGFAERYPRQLSGGQQQRVALARAIVNRPRLLLLDEPLSALDLKLRKRMQLELKHLQERLGIAFVFVTHDQEEAMTVADRLVVMDAGRIEQVGRGTDIYRRPVTRFVAEFVGEANFVPCVPEGDALRPRLGTLPVAAPPGAAGHPGLGVLRPESLRVLDGPAPDGVSTCEGVVEELITVGSHCMIYVRVGADLVQVKERGITADVIAPGATIRLGFRPQDLHVIPG